MKNKLTYIICCLCAVFTLSLVNTPYCHAQKKTTTKKTNTTKKTTTTKNTAKPADKKTQLKNEQVTTQKKRQQSQQQIAVINRNIKSNLDSVMILNDRIAYQQFQIDSLSKEVKAMEERIDTLNARITRTKKELQDKKQKYAHAMIYQQRHKTIQQKLMFIFSAENLSQLIRRMRYMKEYSSYQKVQGELLKKQKAELEGMQEELVNTKKRMDENLQAMKRKEQALEANKKNCQSKVAYLNRNLGTVQNQIRQLQQKEASLNAQIDKLIQEEIAEAKRKEEEAKRKAEEEARKAEEARKEKERQLAEAKRRQEEADRIRKEAEAAAKKAATEEEKIAAKEKAAKAKADANAAAKDIKAAEKEVKLAVKVEKEDANKPKPLVEAYKQSKQEATKLSSNFANNKGKLPMPITGNSTIVGHYGTYTVEGLKKVTLENKGIDIRGEAGCMARSVFDGEVSYVSQYGATYIIMIRHGSYISVYSGLTSVSVLKGNKVTTSQTIGKVGKDVDQHYTLHFQLRKESDRLNPEQWLK